MAWSYCLIARPAAMPDRDCSVLPSISREVGRHPSPEAAPTRLLFKPARRFLDFQSDITPGQPDIMQVAVGPLRQFAALPNPVAPGVQGIADLLHKAPTMMICYRIVRESGHFLAPI
jgi:hypothetical protein